MSVVGGRERARRVSGSGAARTTRARIGIDQHERVP